MKSRTVFSDCEKYATVYTRFIHFLPVDFSSFPQQFLSFYAKDKFPYNI